MLPKQFSESNTKSRLALTCVLGSDMTPEWPTYTKIVLNLEPHHPSMQAAIVIVAMLVRAVRGGGFDGGALLAAPAAAIGGAVDWVRSKITGSHLANRFLETVRAQSGFWCLIVD